MNDICNSTFGFMLGLFLGFIPIGIIWYMNGHKTGIEKTHKIAIEMGCGKYNNTTAKYEWINVREK